MLNKLIRETGKLVGKSAGEILAAPLTIADATLSAIDEAFDTFDKVLDDNEKED